MGLRTRCATPGTDWAYAATRDGRVLSCGHVIDATGYAYHLQGTTAMLMPYAAPPALVLVA
eukprot:327534-Rhodomonas_salina.1